MLQLLLRLPQRILLLLQTAVDLVDRALADVQEFVAVRDGKERDPACLREGEAVMHTVGRQGRGGK